VELAATETVDDARRNALRPQHQRHRRREVLAVSLLAYEKEIRDRVGGDGAGQFQGVAEFRPQIFLEQLCFLEIVGRGGGQGRGKLADTMVHRGELQVVEGDVRRYRSRGNSI